MIIESEMRKFHPVLLAMMLFTLGVVVLLALRLIFGIDSAVAP